MCAVGNRAYRCSAVRKSARLETAPTGTLLFLKSARLETAPTRIVPLLLEDNLRSLF